jgi:hypothetical protein
VALTSLVHISIRPGNWTADTQFEVAFSAKVEISDEFGVSVPPLKTSISAPEGPPATSSPTSDGDNEARTTWLIVGIVLAVAIGLGATALVVTCVYCARQRRRAKVMEEVQQKYKVVLNHSQQSIGDVPANSFVE